MSREEIQVQLQDIICSVIGRDNISITNETTAHDVEGWDSMADLQITTKIKEHFNIKISLVELVSWESVGDIINCIERKVE